MTRPTITATVANPAEEKVKQIKATLRALGKASPGTPEEFAVITQQPLDKVPNSGKARLQFGGIVAMMVLLACAVAGLPKEYIDLPTYAVNIAGFVTTVYVGIAVLAALLKGVLSFLMYGTSKEGDSLSFRKSIVRNGREKTLLFRLFNGLFIVAFALITVASGFYLEGALFIVSILALYGLRLYDQDALYYCLGAVRGGQDPHYGVKIFLAD